MGWWPTPAPIIYRGIAAIIIYRRVNLSARIIVSRNAGNPNEINSLAQFSAIDLKSLTFKEHRL
jgi:hypothetical protein